MASIGKGIDRIPAAEIMLNTASVRKLLEDGRDAEIAGIVKEGQSEGMQDFNSSLLMLIENEMVDPRVAYKYSPNEDELKMRLKGISSR